MGDFGFIFLLVAFAAIFFKVFNRFEFGYTDYSNISTEFLCTAVFVTCLGIGLYLVWFQPTSQPYTEHVAPRVYVSQSDSTHKHIAHNKHSKKEKQKISH
ncbi:MAG: hypothetical protein DKT66_01980 [Candidatus Melainabacteria bacterium]|nr:MAG: hypothetical protein DKT66_01980 [Candidatus Melainabacteria bacterium]